jgi:hypothetical protein
MKKPSPTAIRAAAPLTSRRRPEVEAFACTCGEPIPDGKARAWREHDEHDRPIAGGDAIVFLADGHPGCKRELDAHPRLYAEVMGDPGTFPKLCGPCKLRQGHACSHPDLKSNGGPGLNVQIHGLPAIVCGRGGCHVPVKHAVECAGRRTLKVVP